MLTTLFIIRVLKAIVYQQEISNENITVIHLDDLLKSLKLQNKMALFLLLNFRIFSIYRWHDATGIGNILLNSIW